MTRLYSITKEEVEAAWKAVKSSGGGSGYDEKTIDHVKADEVNQLYKVWNRLSSGSYIPEPVLLIEIPKAKGGTRQLGIPTVVDRIAQNVIKRRLESFVEPYFHVDSYAYQNGKGAIDALAATRERCMKQEWVIDMDIKAFFDELDHDLLLAMVGKYVTDTSTLLYVKKFLKASGITENGDKVERSKGTPQGGVVSPVLANLYLHEAFDSWMSKVFKDIQWERYADDIIVHCVSEKQAEYIKSKIEMRMREFKLSLHPEKTRIVYTGTSNKHDHRGHGLSRKFTFLGYDFKPRRYKNRLVFTPGIGIGAMKKFRQKMHQGWRLHHRLSESLTEIAISVNADIRGMINYFGHYRRSDLYKLGEMIDEHLVSFIRRKHKRIKSWKQGWIELKGIRKERKILFCHWHMISRKTGRGAV